MKQSIRTNVLVALFVLLFVIGAASVAVGLWTRFYIVGENEILSKYLEIDSFHEDLYLRIAYARVGAGAVLIVIPWLGMIFCRRLKRKWQVAAYVLSIALLICAEIAFIVVPIMYKDSSLDDRKKEIKNDIDMYGRTEGIDSTQQEYQCCGASGPDDYIEVSREIPDSCCPNFHCETRIFEDGCVHLAYEKPIMKEISKMVYIALAFGIVEVAVLILALALFCEEEPSNNSARDDSSVRTLRSSYTGSNLEMEKGDKDQNRNRTTNYAQDPSDPLFYQTYMHKYQQRSSAKDSVTAHQTKIASGKDPSQKAFNANDPDNDVLYYQDHMKRFSYLAKR